MISEAFFLKKCELIFLLKSPSVIMPIILSLLSITPRHPKLFFVITIIAFDIFSFLFTKGIAFLVCIISLTYFRSFPRFPPGCMFLNWTLSNPLSSSKDIAKQSPIIIAIVVEDVGAKFNGQASIGFLYKIPIVAFLWSVLFELPVMLIKVMLNLLTNWIKFKSSDVSPELDIAITQSFFWILPKSPWLASVACIKYEGVPVDVNVADSLFPIWALLPTPVTITRPFRLWMVLTALKKLLLKIDDNVFILLSSTVNAFFALFKILLLIFINV